MNLLGLNKNIFATAIIITMVFGSCNDICDDIDNPCSNDFWLGTWSVKEYVKRESATKIDSFVNPYDYIINADNTAQRKQIGINEEWYYDCLEKKFLTFNSYTFPSFGTYNHDNYDVIEIQSNRVTMVYDKIVYYLKDSMRIQDSIIMTR